MNEYTGTAVLLLDDDRQVAADADLRKDDAGSWLGTLTLPAEARTPELLNLTEGTLRINDRDGKFVRPDTSDWMASPAGPLRLRILGNGDAPFWPRTRRSAPPACRSRGRGAVTSRAGCPSSP